MRIGMVGLGRMGANMAVRLIAGGHEVVGTDHSAAAVADLAGSGGTPAATLDDLVAALEPPRVAWLMLPAAVTDRVVDDLAARLAPGDVIVDGGNSDYRSDIARAARLAPTGVRYVDVGVSGGVWGRERGYCLMAGGDDADVALLAPVFRTLAPGVGAAPRTPGREGDPTPAEEGWLHCGPHGAGHFVKMVHNGIEYGLMAAYAEGLNIIRGAGSRRDADVDAETAPRDPDAPAFDVDVAAVAEVWRRGSVVSSWLLDLTAQALAQDPDLSGFAGRVSDSGEGRWTVIAAVHGGTPAPVLATALFERFTSRGESAFADRALSAMRLGFGGHLEKPPSP